MTADAFVFDAYGTLFDVHSAVRQHAEALGPAGARMSQIWRAKQLEYSWVRSLMHSYADFWKLTEEALDFALEASDLNDGNGHLRSLLLDAYWKLEAYSDVEPTLKQIRSSGARVAILSNGSPEMLDAAILSARLENLVDEVFSVDAIKSYKTSPEVYRMVTSSWGLDPAQVSFQSSNRWDIAGAQKFGFRTIWVNRTNQPDEYLNYSPNRVVNNLSEL